MPPRIPKVAIRRSSFLRFPVLYQSPQRCPICSFCRASRASSKRPKTPQLEQYLVQSRLQSNLGSTSTIEVSKSHMSLSSRIELQGALADLQKNAANYVNISRIELAQRGLHQEAGHETVRIAILGLADGGASLRIAKELLRLLLADPLKAEEEWERVLISDRPGGKPLLVKVGHNEPENALGGSRMVQELHVASPVLNGHRLELLVLEMDCAVPNGQQGNSLESALVPTMEIPTSRTGRYTYVATPVHRSLVVSDGIVGAATQLRMLSSSDGIDREIMETTVNISVSPEQKASLPIRVIDVSLGNAALLSFRESVENAIDYEEKWFASNVPAILEWLTDGTAPTEGMKPAIRKLIVSVLQNASLAIEAERSHQLGAALNEKVSSNELLILRQGLSDWAESAHTELRDQLDIAFAGRGWRKLNWWKLFWRVDDISMIAGDVLNQRFLPNAEKSIIYFAGRICGATPSSVNSEVPRPWTHKPMERKPAARTFGSKPPPPEWRDLVEVDDVYPSRAKSQPWPLDIPATRAYLSQETVPALQALAQTLVLQTIATSSSFSALAGLMYASSVTNGLYEAGAVAALGTVLSLRRMQGKWDTARKFWEGEVREEGRKAVRAVESAVGDALVESNEPLKIDPELEKAEEAVARANKALRAAK